MTLEKSTQFLREIVNLRQSGGGKLRINDRTCNPSGSVFCERLEIDSESIVGRVHAVIERTHRALIRSRHAGQLSRRLRNRHWTRALATPAAGSAKARAPEGGTGCGTHAPRSNSDVESRRAHTHGPLLNASSVGDVHRGSRVLAARGSASDWSQRGGRHRHRAAPRRPLPRWMTIMEDVQLARKPNNMNHCIRVQPRPSPVRETPLHGSCDKYSWKTKVCSWNERLRAMMIEPRNDRQGLFLRGRHYDFNGLLVSWNGCRSQLACG